MFEGGTSRMTRRLVVVMANICHGNSLGAVTVAVHWSVNRFRMRGDPWLFGCIDCKDSVRQSLWFELYIRIPCAHWHSCRSSCNAFMHMISIMVSIRDVWCFRNLIDFDCTFEWGMCFGCVGHIACDTYRQLMLLHSCFFSGRASRRFTLITSLRAITVFALELWAFWHVSRLMLFVSRLMLFVALCHAALITYKDAL